MADERPLEEQVRFEIVNEVAWITIDRPGVGNALSPPARDRIRDLVEGLNRSFKARAIVLTAEGEKMFCPGADLSHQYPRDVKEGTPERVMGDARRMMLEGYYRALPALMDSDLPIIAAVNGTAAGAGAHLALACDLVIMAEEAKMVEVFTRRGLVPDALGSYLLPRLVGPQKAKELVFFAEDVPSAEALRLGLVNKVVPRSELRAAAADWAERLAQGPTRAYALSKWLINKSMDGNRQQAIEDESWAVQLNMYTEDANEGIASFRERRAPTWTGF